MNEIVKKEFYEVISPKDIEDLKTIDELEKRVKVIKDKIKKSGKEFLLRNGLSSYSQDGVNLVYKPSYEKTIVDTQKMKDEGIYDFYTKQSVVSDSVSVSIEYEE